MQFKIIDDCKFSVGDLVHVKTMNNQETFCIIGFKKNNSQQTIAILKALFNEIYIIEKPLFELKSLLTKGNL